MKNPLLYFSISILVLNLLFIIIAVANNFVGFFGALVGGSAAILTDPVILVVGILGGVALATQRIKFAVIALVVGAIIAAVVVHFILGTTRFIVDVVRVNVFLIIPSIIILIASGFNKLTNKTIKKKPLAKKVKVKTVVNKDSNKGLRFLLVISLTAVAGALLFIPNDEDSLFGGYVTKPITSIAITKTKIKTCNEKLVTVKNPFYPNMTREEWENGKMMTNTNEATRKMYNRIILFSKEWKTVCYSSVKDRYLRENKITEKDLNRLLIKGTVTKRYYTDPYLLKRAIKISHPILFIISLLAIWRLRFCITAVIIKSFNRIKSEI